MKEKSTTSNGKILDLEKALFLGETGRRNFLKATLRIAPEDAQTWRN
jgi:hypothetical protein